MDEKFPNAYVVNIDNNPIFIHVVETDSEIKEWIREVQAIRDKRNKRNLIVGLYALCSQHYANGNHSYYLRRKERKEEKPYELLQLCVGTHCLIMELDSYGHILKTLKEFLYDNKTVVVGVGIEKIATKLEKEWKKDRLMITKRVELREEAEKCFPGNKLEKSDLEELARVVLRGELNYVKPRKVTWQSWRDHELTQELIQFACVETFLAREMGSVLLKNYIRF